LAKGPGFVRRQNVHFAYLSLNSPAKIIMAPAIMMPTDLTAPFNRKLLSSLGSSGFLSSESRSLAAWDLLWDLLRNQQAAPNMQSPEPKEIRLLAPINPKEHEFMNLSGALMICGDGWRFLHKQGA